MVQAVSFRVAKMTTEASEIDNSSIQTSGKDQGLVSTRVISRKKGVSAYAKNPFWDPYSVEIGQKKVTIAGGFLTQPETGETTHHAGIHRVEFVDEDRFVKLFTQNLRVFFDLSAASQKVLQCVLHTLQESPNKDGIFLPWFTVEDYSKLNEMKMSRATFHRALKEMLEKGFLAESEHASFYWINPHLFFNGNRMMFITEYVKLSKGNNGKIEKTERK